MKIRDILQIANNIEQKEVNLVYKDLLITIRYSLIFNRINVRVNISDEDFILSLKLNQDDLELDLTEENGLNSKIPSNLYHNIIDAIFNEEF